MLKDEIVDEVRAFREAHAAKFDFNFRAIYEDLKKSEKESLADGFKFANLPIAKPDLAIKNSQRKARTAHL